MSIWAFGLLSMLLVLSAYSFFQPAAVLADAGLDLLYEGCCGCYRERKAISKKPYGIYAR